MDGSCQVKTFTPTGGRILVKPDTRVAREHVTEGGLVLPEFSVPQVSTGRVAAVSGSSEFDVGQRVVFSPYSGFSVSVDREAFLIITEGEILGRFEGEADVLVR